MNQLKSNPARPGTAGVRLERMVHTGAMGPGHIVGLCAAAFLLGACDTTNYAAKQEAKTPAAPVAPTEIVTGSQLTLRKSLNLPAGGAPVLFQNNAIVTQAELANNAPFCRFNGANSSAPRTLKPSTLTVRSIDYDERQSAAGRKPIGVTHYRLASDPKHPGYVLSCQWPEGAPALAFVTADEVQATISAFFRLDPAR